MGRYLRPLAVVVTILEVCIAFFATPLLGVTRPRFLIELEANSLISQSLIMTGILLTFFMGILALVVAAQRGQRPWFIIFLVLLILFAYSPLLLTWVQESQTFIYGAPRFYVNTTAFTIVQLSNLILPAIILAIVVFVYSLRYGQTRAERVR